MCGSRRGDSDEIFESKIGAGGNTLFSLRQRTTAGAREEVMAKQAQGRFHHLLMSAGWLALN